MPFPLSARALLERHRLARSRLANEPWATGAGFGLGVLAITLLCRIGMLGVGAKAGFLHDLGPRHALWIGPALAHDLVVTLGLTVLMGGLLRLSRGFARKLALLFGYAALVFASLVCIVSVPLYGTLQSTLQLTQLLLAGGISDIADSAFDVVPAFALASALAFVVIACACVPWFGVAALSLRASALRPRARAYASLVALGLATTAAFAPPGGAGGLETDPFYEFVASAGRYLLRSRSDGAPIDMSRAPHFDRSLIRGDRKQVDDVERLVNVDALPQRRSNVVLIVLESAANSQYGLWDGPPETTPRLRELAAHGLVFEDYYTPTPVSMKSLFSMHCSTYPMPHPNADTYINPGMPCSSISELLKAEGYRTALFHGGHFSYTQKDAFFNGRGYDVMRDAETLNARRRHPKVAWGVDDRAVVDDALAWLDQHDASQPFFLDLIFLSPHHPYDIKDTPTPFGKKTEIDRYRNAVLFIDSQIGRLWDFLKERGQTDNTLFVIAGDHGEAFGEHRGHFTHGTRLYEEAVRTPMMLVHPKLFSGSRTKRVGNHLDIAPTILDVLGLKKPDRHQGQSLLRGYEPGVVYLYGDWHRHYLGLRDGRWKYIRDLDQDTHELFDLATDRKEQRNLASERKDQVELYAKRTDDWERFYQELIPSYELYVVSKGACPGRGACFLDELSPVFRHGDMRKNKNVVGRPLELGKRTYSRGLGVKPLSILRYSLRGQGFRTLSGAVGLHNNGTRNPNSSLKVSVEVYLDERLVWSSGKLTASEEATPFSIDVKGGSVLELISHDVDGEDWHDWVNWVDVRLER